MQVGKHAIHGSCVLGFDIRYVILFDFYLFLFVCVCVFDAADCDVEQYHDHYI